MTGQVTAREPRPVRHHLPLDAAAFLGAGARQVGRLRPRRHPDDAERRRSGRDAPADPGLHRRSSPRSALAPVALGFGGLAYARSSRARRPRHAGARARQVYRVARGRARDAGGRSSSSASRSSTCSCSSRRCWPSMAFGLFRPVVGLSRWPIPNAAVTEPRGAEAPPPALARHRARARRARGPVLRGHDREARPAASCSGRCEAMNMQPRPSHAPPHRPRLRSAVAVGMVGPRLRGRAALRPVLQGHRLRRHADRARPGPPARCSTATMAVRFDANVAPGLTWRFAPEMPEVEGQARRDHDRALQGHERRRRRRRPASRPSTSSPRLAAAYFVKLECFCFTEQTLKPGETMESAVVFYVDPSLDSRTRT